MTVAPPVVFEGPVVAFAKPSIGPEAVTVVAGVRWMDLFVRTASVWVSEDRRRVDAVAPVAFAKPAVAFVEPVVAAEASFVDVAATILAAAA